MAVFGCSTASLVPGDLCEFWGKQLLFLDVMQPVSSSIYVGWRRDDTLLRIDFNVPGDPERWCSELEFKRSELCGREVMPEHIQFLVFWDAEKRVALARVDLLDGFDYDDGLRVVSPVIDAET